MRQLATPIAIKSIGLRSRPFPPKALQPSSGMVLFRGRCDATVCTFLSYSTCITGCVAVPDEQHSVFVSLIFFFYFGPSSVGTHIAAHFVVRSINCGSYAQTCRYILATSSFFKQRSRLPRCFIPLDVQQAKFEEQIFFQRAGRTGGKTFLRASYAHGAAAQQASGRERKGRFLVVFSTLALAHLPFEFSVSCCQRECSRRDSNAEPSDP